MPLQAIRRVPTRDLAAAARLSTETTVLVSVADVALIALLRYFGKRALSKFNAFDVIITVAVGSCLASAVMTKDITLADGVVAFCAPADPAATLRWTRSSPGLVRPLCEESAAVDYLSWRHSLGPGPGGTAR